MSEIKTEYETGRWTKVDGRTYRFYPEGLTASAGRAEMGLRWGYRCTKYAHTHTAAELLDIAAFLRQLNGET